MPSDDDQRFRDALVVGSLLAPEGAAAYAHGDALVGVDAGERARSRGRAALADPGPDPRSSRRSANRPCGPSFSACASSSCSSSRSACSGPPSSASPGCASASPIAERTVVDMFDRSDLCGGVPGGRRRPRAGVAGAGSGAPDRLPRAVRRRHGAAATRVPRRAPRPAAAGRSAARGAGARSSAPATRCSSAAARRRGRSCAAGGSA